MTILKPAPEGNRHMQQELFIEESDQEFVQGAKNHTSCHHELQPGENMGGKYRC
jgi:hypothetical protein